MNTDIRRATSDDVQTLSTLGVRTFAETFGHLYPAEDLQAFLVESHSHEAYTCLLADPDCALWLAEEQGVAIGYALAGPCNLPHAEAEPGDGELKRLYVLSSRRNGGCGGKLVQVALDWLERGGPRTLWIGVWSENLDAQRFYARHGFAKIGEYEFPVGRVRDREFILRRPAS